MRRVGTRSSPPPPARFCILAAGDLAGLLGPRRRHGRLGVGLARLHRAGDDPDQDVDHDERGDEDEADEVHPRPRVHLHPRVQPWGSSSSVSITKRVSTPGRCSKKAARRRTASTIRRRTAASCRERDREERRDAPPDARQDNRSPGRGGRSGRRAAVAEEGCRRLRGSRQHERAIKIGQTVEDVPAVPKNHGADQWAPIRTGELRDEDRGAYAVRADYQMVAHPVSTPLYVSSLGATALTTIDQHRGQNQVRRRCRTAATDAGYLDGVRPRTSGQQRTKRLGRSWHARQLGLTRGT